MPTLFLALLAGASSPAHAAGVGSSIGVLSYDLGAFRPSLDLHFEPVIVQIHVLDFLDELSQDDVQLGANLYFRAADATLPGGLTAVVQPGVGLDLFIDPTAVFLAGDVRFGAEASSDKGGFGVYVVPSLGLRFDNDEGNNPFFAGGALQFSAWFGN